jgi:LacI family transcriptional regulator
MTSVTIRDVARMAGVSVGTASRVINNASTVGPDNVLRVREAISKLGFVPDRNAQAMRGNSYEIGIIVRDITIPVLAGFVKAAQTVFDAHGYAMLINSVENNRGRELQMLDQFCRRRIDGLIMTTASEDDAQLVRAREKATFPILLSDRDLTENCDCTLIDHEFGTYQAVSYLIGLGHRRILLITGSTDVYPGRSRVRGYHRAFKDAGLSVDPHWVRFSTFESSTAFFETSSSLDEAVRPTAVLAGGIDMLTGVLKAIRGRGLRIPEDISVIGNSDSDLALLSTPPITVVKWDYEDVGRASAQLILDRIMGKVEERRRIVFPTELVIRGSCSAI